MIYVLFYNDQGMAETRQFTDKQSDEAALFAGNQRENRDEYGGGAFIAAFSGEQLFITTHFGFTTENQE